MFVAAGRLCRRLKYRLSTPGIRGRTKKKKTQVDRSRADLTAARAVPVGEITTLSPIAATRRVRFPRRNRKRK